MTRRMAGFGGRRHRAAMVKVLARFLVVKTYVYRWEELQTLMSVEEGDRRLKAGWGQLATIAVLRIALL